MPVSMTATTTFELPVVTFHASGASMSASVVPVTPRIGWPVLCSPYCSPKRESFGMPAARMR